MENYARLLVGMGCMKFVLFLGMVMAAATDLDRFIVGGKSSTLPKANCGCYRLYTRSDQAIYGQRYMLAHDAGVEDHERARCELVERGYVRSYEYNDGDVYLVSRDKQ
jgi:hypothetical protein